MVQAPLILRLLAVSTSTARQAGKIIRTVIASKNLGIIVKKEGDNNIQTEADRSSQKCIFASLTKHFPNVKIIGEEENVPFNDVPKDWIVDGDQEVLSKVCPKIYSDVLEKDIVIWVDPLDGTRELRDGFYNHVTVLIGIAVKGKPVAGVISQPLYEFKPENPEVGGRTLWGMKDLGVFGIKVTAPPKDKFIITTGRYHRDSTLPKSSVVYNPDEVIRVGGAGFKVLMLIEGKAHFYIFPNEASQKWDICGPQALLETTGGVLTDICNRQYEFHAEASYPNSSGVFATPKGQDHAALLRRIPKAVVERFANKQ